MKIAVASVLLLTACAATETPVPSAATGTSYRPTFDGTVLKYVDRSRRPSSLRVSRQARRRPVAHNWNALAACESSSNWSTNTGNGYYGGVQMDLTFWRNYGGMRFAPRPDLATKAQQITVAERGLRVQGIGSWPTCGWRLAN